jgi:prophage regulatory protein
MTEKPKFLRLAQVIELTGYKRTSIYTKAKEGTFPKPIKLSPRQNVWLESSITDWINNQVAQSMEKAA